MSGADEAVRDVTPTARLVLAVLRERASANQTELVEATGRTRRTVRSAVTELEARGAISASYDLRDARNRRYELEE